MPAYNHANYNEELEKLDYIKNYLRNYNEKISGHKLKIDKEVDYGKSHYNSDNAEQFNELIINTALQDSMSKKLKDVTKGLSKPYFARVDFNEENSNKQGKYYIGKMSLMREEDHELIILDWRAPLASLYYEGRLGNASYTCLDGEIKGDIKLKRQYTIEKGELKEIFDVDITTNDDFLQAALGSNKDNRLKDIVSTIQSEQNRVIRADMWNPLIVQGAAGGGKTTIALHRIAYLMYTHEKTIRPKDFMIIAPNRFFLSYISDVLPELGVENVTQTTFEDLAFEVIGKKLKLNEPYEKLSTIIENYSSKDSKRSNNLIKSSTFKSSLEFKDMLEKYINLLENNFIPKIDFKIHDFVLFSYKELNRQFLYEYSNLPFMKRINEIKKSLVNKVKYEKNKILDHVEYQYDIKLNTVRDQMPDCPKRREKIIFLADERDNLLLNIKKGLKTMIRDYISKITTSSVLDYYTDFLSSLEKFTENTSLNETMKYLKDYSLNNLLDKTVEMEDLSPLMYLKLSIFGLEDKISLKHVVIDEAQDFSLFQLFILEKIINSGSFTILGDLCQGIYSYRGINDWNDISKYIFAQNSSTHLSLEQSYRTTVEIMNAASSVIGSLNDPRLPKAKPVIRHGDEVTVYEKNSLKEIAADIENRIIEMKEENYKSMAIICKTLKECLELKKLLKQDKNISVITGKEKDYSGGVVIIPSYLVKGLEFDIVIVANASKENYTERDLDVKLLYVAMTRPLHKLYIYSVGDKSKMLSF
ncbi:RNA polymerase recycling motor HelD [Clostridium sp. CF012]|uniref:RNA polymerase recycling motor HelD n=1 Tax=Clostridium sp. CF012 TaxID=2843319 RepID=UPI001C0AED8A|nr:RNA polymerase recycling motor HelD [Clostridium sp. CF012]MBU3146069.1 AAA family ATPase [Clostridium sp. CF012]